MVSPITTVLAPASAWKVLRIKPYPFLGDSLHPSPPQLAQCFSFFPFPLRDSWENSNFLIPLFLQSDRKEEGQSSLEYLHSGRMVKNSTFFALFLAISGIWKGRDSAVILGPFTGLFLPPLCNQHGSLHDKKKPKQKPPYLLESQWTP